MDASNDTIPISLGSHINTWNVLTAIVCLALNWFKSLRNMRELHDPGPNKYHEFKLPVEQAICPPDHPSVVYQPRLRSLLTTIQKVNDQCWWSQNIKNECFQLGSHKDSKWMAPISLFLYRKSNTTSLAKTTILFLKHWHLAIKKLRRWGTSLPPLAWPWDLLPKSMSTLNQSVMPAIKLRRLDNLERTGFYGAPAAIEDMTSGKLTLC